MKGIKVDREQIRKNGFPSPIPLSEGLLESFSEKEKGILFSLLDLAEEEKRLDCKINYVRPTASGTLVLPGGLTVCEDEDDCKVITMKERLELNGVRKKITAALGEALDSGLGYLGLIQRQCANYGVKP